MKTIKIENCYLKHGHMFIGRKMLICKEFLREAFGKLDKSKKYTVYIQQKPKIKSNLFLLDHGCVGAFYGWTDETDYLMPTTFALDDIIYRYVKFTDGLAYGNLYIQEQ